MHLSGQQKKILLLLYDLKTLKDNLGDYSPRARALTTGEIMDQLRGRPLERGLKILYPSFSRSLKTLESQELIKHEIHIKYKSLIKDRSQRTRIGCWTMTEEGIKKAREIRVEMLERIWEGLKVFKGFKRFFIQELRERSRNESFSFKELMKDLID